MKIKNITYSSEYVAELEEKIEHLKEENAELKRKYFIQEREIHHLGMYKEALKLAISDAIIIGGCDFWKEAASRCSLQELYNKCIHRNVLNIVKGVEEFYFSIVANAKAQKSEVKEK